MSTKKVSTLDRIMNSHTPTAESVAIAVEKYNQEKTEQMARRIISQIESMDQIEGRMVNHLRKIREEEKKAIAELKAFNAAKEAFIKTADADAFNKAVRPLGYYI